MLAHHYSRSPNVEKAIDYLELANLKAIKANAAADAEVHFEAALQLYSKFPDTRENRRRRIATLLQQVPVYLLQLKLTQYEQLLRAHESVAVSLEDDGLLGRFYGCIGHCQWFMGRHDEGLESEGKAAALCEKAGEMGGAAFAYGLTQYLLWSKGDLQRSLEFEAPCLRALALSPNLRVYMWSPTISGWALGNMGQFERGLAKCELAMSAGDAASDPSIVCECLWTMAIIFLDQGALDKAVEYAQRAIEVGPTPADKAWAQVTLGWALSRRCPEASLQLLEPLEPVFRSAGQMVTVVWLGVALGEAYWRAGRLQEALRTLDDTAKLSQRSRAKHWEGNAHRLLGEIGIEQDKADALGSARNHFNTALSLFEICGAEPDIARTYAGLGQLRLRQGKIAKAHSDLDKTLEISERLGMIGEPERVRQIIQQMSPA